MLTILASSSRSTHVALDTLYTGLIDDEVGISTSSKRATCGLETGTVPS